MYSVDDEVQIPDNFIIKEIFLRVEKESMEAVLDQGKDENP